MKRLEIIVWSALALGACVPPKPPQPMPPPQPMRAIGAVLMERMPVAGLDVSLATQDGVTAFACGTSPCRTDATGYVGFPSVPIGAALRLNYHGDGYLPGSITFTLMADQGDLRVPVAKAKPRFATADELRNIRANFCNLHDSQGRVMFAPDYIGLSDDDRSDWRMRYVAAGSRHVVLSPIGGSYPGSWVPYTDIYGQPDRFAAFVREILETPGPDGAGLTPILILDDGTPGIRDRIRQFWPAIRAALGDDAEHVIVVPGWELVPSSSATSADLSFALLELHAEAWPHIWVHLGPNRASGASNPLEVSDPWQGAEAGFFTDFGGQYIEGLLYQSDALRPNDDRCDPTSADCWLNRWDDVVIRLGTGFHGWRVMSVAFFEGPAYFYFRNQSDTSFANRAAAAARLVCDRYGVRCGFGNGNPDGPLNLAVGVSPAAIR